MFKFHIGLAVPTKPECEHKEDDWANEPEESLLIIHFSKLEVQFHTNLPLDAVTRKVVLEYVG